MLNAKIKVFQYLSVNYILGIFEKCWIASYVNTELSFKYFILIMYLNGLWFGVR